MATFRIQKRYRSIAWAAGLFLAGLVLAVHLLLPHLVNTRSMQRRILSLAAEALPGEFGFQHLAPALLPWPHVVLTRGRWTLSGQFDLQVARVEVRPAFWLLLQGRLKIKRLRVIDPGIVVQVPDADSLNAKGTHVPLAATVRERAGAALAAALPLIDGMAISLEGGRVTLRRAGQLPLGLEQIDLQASALNDELKIRLQSRSAWLKGLSLDGQLNLATMDGNGRLQFEGLDTRDIRSWGWFAGSAHIPEMTLDGSIRMTAHKLTQGAAHFEASAPAVMVKRADRQLTLAGVKIQGQSQWSQDGFEARIEKAVAAEPDLRLQGAVNWPGRHSPSQTLRVALQGTVPDLDALRGKFLDLGGDNATIARVFAIVRGGRVPNVQITLSAPGWKQIGAVDNIKASADISDGRLNIENGLLHLTDVNGRVTLQAGQLAGEAIEARSGNTGAENGTFRLDLHKGAKAFHLETDLDADLSEVAPVLKKIAKHPQMTDLLDRLPPVSGRAAGRFILGDRLDRLRARLDVKADMQMLDAAVKVESQIDGLPAPQTRARLQLSGSLGPEAVDWIGRLADLPDDDLPGRISIARAEIRRNQSGHLALDGQFALGHGLTLSAAMSKRSGMILVKKLHLSDGASDATVSVKHALDTPRWDIRFAGELHGATLDTLWPGNHILSGRVRGQMHALVDAAAPGRTALQGSLTAQGIDLPGTGTDPVRIVKAGLVASGRKFTLSAADLVWQQQTATLTGKGTLADQVVVLDLNVASGDLDADKLMEAFWKHTAPTDTPSPPPGHNPLIRGKIALAVERMRLGGFQFSAVQAGIALEKDRSVLDVTRSTLCGIEIPGRITFARDGMVLAFVPRAEKTPLSAGSECLDKAGITERLDGSMTLNLRIVSRGKQVAELIRNLEGQGKIRIREGKIYNIGSAGFFTNLLAYMSVNQLVKGGMPDLRKTDFHYDSMTSQFEFKDGRTRFKEGVLKSSSVNIVGDGRYDLLKNDLDLKVLVSPLTSVDWLIERLPIVGRILQGTLVAIPVGIKGPVADPAVIPLAPGAVGSRVGGILKRTLETPFRIIEPILPDDPES